MAAAAAVYPTVTRDYVHTHTPRCETTQTGRGMPSPTGRSRRNRYGHIGGGGRENSRANDDERKQTRRESHLYSHCPSVVRFLTRKQAPVAQAAECCPTTCSRDSGSCLHFQRWQGVGRDVQAQQNKRKKKFPRFSLRRALPGTTPNPLAGYGSLIT